VHPYRYLALFLALLIGVYLLVFLTGNKQAKPKLGIDLQGGTRVTLTARTPDGSKPTRDALNQAQQIIGARVNGLGVSGSEVVIDGDNLVITVPGADGNDARSLGQTARLFIRPVIGQPIPVQAIKDSMKGPQGAAPGGPGGPPPPPGAPPPPPPPGAEPAPAPAPAPQPRPFPQEPTPTPPPSESPSPSESPAPSASESPAPGQPAPPGAPGQAPPSPPDENQTLAKRIEDEKNVRQSTNQGVMRVAVLYMAGRCDQEDVLAGNDDPNLPLVTCSQDRKFVYVLDKSIISGDQIKSAASGMDQSSAYVVDVEFKEEAAKTWADFTASNIGVQTAFTLDSQVVSAPQIREAIPGGRTQISGGDPPFTADSAKTLANVLKYGSLPLSFVSSEAETVSPTLGLTSLKAGLIAGAIGLAMVLLYSLLYYRVLGLLTALSLVASGAMVFGILVLLGRYINYTLDLAGIAGLIIGIGTTADSFVVFFERIKDEIREGRSFRSAVPRGWARARKTILSGNAVSFLAAAVLYFLAVGQVKGFAFTLGLTTILDVVVVFMVTWPLVYLASKSPTLSKPSFNGLGAVQQIARERRAAGQIREVAATGRGSR
jgi:preprotein translocase subunit SecD